MNSRIARTATMRGRSAVFSAVLLAAVLAVSASSTAAFAASLPKISRAAGLTRNSVAFSRGRQLAFGKRVVAVKLHAKNNRAWNDDDDDDDDDSMKKAMDEVFESGSITGNRSGNSNNNDNKREETLSTLDDLGIDINAMMEPMSEDEKAKLVDDAREIIDEAFEVGTKAMKNMRARMERENERSRRAMDFASELEAKRLQEELEDKINRIAGDFLSKTESQRLSTKQAAAASRAMEGSGQGLEMGTWGKLNGRTVLADDSLAGRTSSALIGSVDDSLQQTSKTSVSSSSELNLDDSISVVKENKIIIIADVKQDPLARQLVPILERDFGRISKLPNLSIQVLTPTATMPLGGKDADCVVVFCPSISQSSSLKQILDKLLRKTFNTDGALGRPPTQIVGITTVGTERTDKFPYSMQNLMGGKLDKRRQVEEVIINTVQRRVMEPPLDYTLIKLGEIKDGEASKNNFELSPGDSLDGPISAATAEQVVIQALAFQPNARNATLSVSGSLPEEILSTDDDSTSKQRQLFWADAFVVLEGPELWRIDLPKYDVELYGELSEYIREWATLLGKTGKGLTTPIQVLESAPAQQSAFTVKQQNGVQLLFLPTATGKNYMSKDEERQQESRTSTSTATPNRKISSRRIAKEGGITVLVEQTRDDTLRIRARRSNYMDDAVIKEISEETILARLQEAVSAWQKERDGARKDKGE